MNTLIRAAARLSIRPSLGQIMKVTPNNQVVNKSLISKRFAHNFPLTYDFAREKILLVLRLYDKIDPEKLTLNSHFIDDLGLDSLDHTEIIMEIEDEFGFEIPDKDAEKLLTPGDILRYISDKEECYKELQELQIKSHHDHHHHAHDYPSEDQDKLGGLHVEGSHYNEFTMPNRNHHHHTSDTGNHAHDSSNVQKRTYTTWSTMAKRWMSDDSSKQQWPTSFSENPPTLPNYDAIRERVMKVLSKYDKIDATKLTELSHLVEDLGLDSLDHVEIMMEMEDEFGLEIPDKDAEKLMKPVDIAKYLFQNQESRSINETTERHF